MQIDDAQAQRLGTTLVSVSERIGRLSISLGIQLDNPLVVQALIDQPLTRPAQITRRSSAPESKMYVPAMTHDRRRAHLHVELRALLVLQHQITTKIINDLGFVVACRIIGTAQKHLVQQGFKPGANGLNLVIFSKQPNSP